MAKVGIERFRPGDREEHGAEREETDDPVSQQELNAVERIERPHDRRVLHDMDEPARRDDHEPHRHHRPKERRDARGAARLHRQQHEQDQHCQRHHVGIERGGYELETFDRREHRNSRRDHRVAVEKRGADHAQHEDNAGPAPDCALRQCHQRERPAFPVVVGA